MCAFLSFALGVGGGWLLFRTKGEPQRQTAAKITARQLVSSPGFWDQPEQEQIDALSQVAPQFKSYPLPVQQGILQKARQQFGQTNDSVFAETMPQGQTAQQIVQSPGFWDQPEQKQIDALVKINPKFASAPAAVQKGVLQKARQRYRQNSSSGTIWNRGIATIIGSAVVTCATLWLVLYRRRMKQAPRRSKPTRSRLESIVIWFTASLVLLEIMCPATVLLIWNDDGYWKQIPSHTVSEIAKDEKYRWADAIGHRKGVTALEQWKDAYSGVYFKEWPDMRRMVAETLMTIMIGGGLIVATGRKIAARRKENGD